MEANLISKAYSDGYDAALSDDYVAPSYDKDSEEYKAWVKGFNDARRDGF
jgi:hypothetical protein